MAVFKFKTYKAYIEAYKVMLRSTVTFHYHRENQEIEVSESVFMYEDIKKSLLQHI